MPTPPLDGRTQRNARRGLAIYFAIVVVLSAAIEGFVIGNPSMDGLIAVLMFVPAIASVVARLALRESFSDVSFRFGGRRGLGAVGIALVFPIAVGLVAYGIAWTTGLAGFDARPSSVMMNRFLPQAELGLRITLPRRSRASSSGGRAPPAAWFPQCRRQGPPGPGSGRSPGSGRRRAGR